MTYVIAMSGGPSAIGNLLSLFLFFVIPMALIAFFAMRQENRMINDWSEVATGEFHIAEYGEYRVTERRGSMVHHSSARIIDCTIVRFTDGRAFPCRGRLDLPYPAGTIIRLMENKLGQRKVVAT